jgi:hypothetical protein
MEVGITGPDLFHLRDYCIFQFKPKRYMKHLLTILIINTLYSCSNRNNLTTQLLNDKKATEDSIKDATNYEAYYKEKATEEMHASHDSLKWMPLSDSSTYFFARGHALKKRLKDIEFSLDSLSKMK